MLTFILNLPDTAFTMAGEVGTEDRLLYCAAPPGTPPQMLSNYPRVVYRFGWRGQGDRVTVAFALPASAGGELLYVSIHASSWGTIPSSIWKQMLLRYIPLGVYEFPVLEY